MTIEIVAIVLVFFAGYQAGSLRATLRFAAKLKRALREEL